jgi:predicted phosphodiesterase
MGYGTNCICNPFEMSPLNSMCSSYTVQLIYFHTTRSFSVTANKMLLTSIGTFVFSMMVLLGPPIGIPTFNIIISASAQGIPDFNVAADGDWGCNSISSVTVNKIAGKHPELVLGLGDYSYRTTANCWLDLVSPLKSKMKIAIGNHDHDSTTLLNQYMSSFGLTNQYYSFNYQNIHFLVLSTERPYTKGSQQYAFAENDLAKASANPAIKWLVVYYHKLAYSSSTTSPIAIPGLRDALHPLFDKYHVDIVLQGHHHAYERTYPIKYNAATPSSPIVTVRQASNYHDPAGEIFLTVGAAGANIDLFGAKKSYSVMQYRGHGFLDMAFTNGGTTLKATFYANDGSIKDQFTLTKG